MSRVLKDPEVRKQEILDTAMVLFSQKGYDSTSIADIAKAMNVVPGLCYRYFTSKQDIFNQAVKEYAKESCQDTVEIIQDRTKTFSERMKICGDIMLHKDENSWHHDFFHTSGNETFHLQLSIEMIKYLTPYCVKEISELNNTGELKVEDPEIAIEFILYGLISLVMPENQGNLEEQIKKVYHYISMILQ